MAKTLALANQKGGVGKTTTAVSLAATLAERGLNILLIDLDPQGNTTSSLGIDKNRLPYSSYELMLEDAALDEVLQVDARPGIDLIGANPALAGAEVELVSLRQRERRLERALARQRLTHDLVIIDCPPSLGLLTVSALVAAEHVVIPIQCEYLALEGLMQLVNSMDLVKRRLNPALDVLGVVMTMYDARTRLSAEVVESVHRYFPSRQFRTVIPRSVRLAEAPSHGQTIFEYAPQSAGALAYRAFGVEVADRLGLALSTDADGAEVPVGVSVVEEHRSGPEGPSAGTEGA